MPFVLVAISTQELGLVSMKELFNFVADTCSEVSAPKSDSEMRVTVPLSFRTSTGQANLAGV
jgi:hypothetical protein